MRQGGLAIGVVLLLLAAGCNGSSSEPSSAPSTSSAGSTEASTDTGATETRPAPTGVVNPGKPGAGGRLALQTVASGFDSPVFAAAPPGEKDRLYVVEQTGKIWRVDVGASPVEIDQRPFLDLSAKISTGGERGLLSMAFHPDYETNGLFYVNYTDVEGDTRVEEYRAAEGSEPELVREILYVPQPYANHNGGQLQFGPDGLLYVGMGDGGSGGDPENRAQDLSSRLGKLLRLDVDGTSTEWEMIAYGLRNPWRFSFDRVTGDLWIGDVGQDSAEEIDFVGVSDLNTVHNFGWDVFEGSESFEDKVPAPGGELVDPTAEYTHDFGCSVTGGYVYRGKKLRKQAWGRYFYGDYCSGRIWSVARWNDEVTRRGHPFVLPGLTSFAEDGNGELYFISSDGTLRRLVPR
jgi:glucose/arabinose dehydrogenase